jgi:hypothetical protein
MSKHWSERVKDSLIDSAKFMAEYGAQFGMASFGVLGVAAATAGAMAAGSDNAMVGDQLEVMAVSLGFSGVLAGGYTTAASIMCQRIVDKVDLGQQITENRLTDLVEKMTGQRLGDLNDAMSNLASDPAKDRVMRDILKASNDPKMMALYEDMATSDAVGQSNRQANMTTTTDQADDEYRMAAS